MRTRRTAKTVNALCFIGISDRAQAEFSYCHSVTNQGKGSCIDQLVVGKVVDGDMLGTEIQVFGSTVEGVGFLRAILWAELAETDAVIFNEPLGLKPQPGVCGQQIDRRHEGIIVSV